MDGSPAASPAAPLATVLTLALERRMAGFHRVLVGAPGAAGERFARAHAGHHARLVYRVRLRPWLAQTDNPLDVLYPYRLMARAAPAGTLAVVDDADALFAAGASAWRRDPLAARLVRRALLASRVPTFWCTPSLARIGGELAAHAPAITLGPDLADRPAPAPAHAPAGSPEPDPEPDDPLAAAPSELGLMVLARL